MGPKANFYKRFASRMRLLAIIAGAIIALIPPASYFSISYAEEKAVADRMSQEVSQRIKAVVKVNPDLWKYSVIKFVKVFDETENAEIAEIRIYDSAGSLLDKSAFDRKYSLVRGGGSDIVYNNEVYGRVELDKIADSTLYFTLFLALGFFALGAVVSYMLFHYPALFVRNAEEDINATMDELSLEVQRRLLREGELVDSLKQKEVLLMEVHHRVKNNLQIINSIINMQIHTAPDSEAMRPLLDMKNRVHAMAVVHEHLYSSEDLTNVDINSYMLSLTADYIVSFQENSIHIASFVDAEGISLPLGYAMPLGLIVCELVTNSCKHAFHGRSHGRIEVTLRRSGDAMDLAVKDDGIGAREEDFAPRPDRLGFRLVAALASQIRGKLSTEMGPEGFTVRVDGIDPTAG